MVIPRYYHPSAGHKLLLPELGPVALDDLADLLALVVAPHHLHLVLLPHRHRPHVVLSAQLLGQRGGHQTAPGQAGWSRVG